MRQVLLGSSAALVARMPRPPVEPGSVLVRVRYSLISAGTELAALRPLASAHAGATTAERVSDLSNRALFYLGRAANDPRRAARKIVDIVRLAMARRAAQPSREPAPPVPLGPIAWRGERALSCEMVDGALQLVTDRSEAQYQALSQRFDIPEGRIAELALSGTIAAGAVSVGALDADGARWLGLYTLEAGAIEERLRFDPAGSPSVIIVIANAGYPGESRLTLQRAEVAALEPDGSGLPVSEMGDQGSNVGYSAAGEVIAVGDGVTDIAVGDLVACGGAGQANHADYISVKRNLVCRVPENCPLDLAATTTVGIIALQGVRRAAVEVGDTVCVIGLGLIGIITVELLRAAGCRVIGFDLNPNRVARAAASGAEAVADAEALKRLVRDRTLNYGADQTIVTAATKSSAPVNLAMEVTRRRGRVVLVGDVGLKFERPVFYRKEIDVLMSTSYGPGRYDSAYEEAGRDYPYAYVRWTLNRNMQAYMQLIADGKIDVRRLVDRIAPVDEAPSVYRELAQGDGPQPLAVLFRYPDDGRPLAEPGDATRITLRGAVAPKTDRVNYALVGAGAFGTSMLVPQMEKRKDRFFLRGVVSRDPLRGGNFARVKQIATVASELGDVLSDDEFQLMVIATRHHDHAAQTIAALKAGKHVFVEKPLAVTWEQLDEVRECYESLAERPLLLVGFNRRFSPALQLLGDKLRDRRSPLMINYRLNGGYIPPDSWIQTEQGAGRNIGEACHMYDVFRFLAGAPVASITASAIDPGALPYLRNDNFCATLRYEDGSLATLTYTALGPKEGLPKERIEIFCDGDAYVVDDFKSLTRASSGEVLWQGAVDKGHFEELSRFGDAIAGGLESPISFSEIVETTAVALHVEDLLVGRIGRDIS